MRRIIGVVILVIAVTVVAVSGIGASDDGGYEVRAVFDNAGFAVTGEDVRIAGAKVGSVADVEISGEDEPVLEDGSPDPGKAIIVLSIDDAAFQDFRQDASCLIRPQSLIGEKIVECRPTEPRAPGTPPPPELEQIPDGQPGAGQYLLPLERNGKAVDLDLVNNIMKAPYPDRFRLILNDLGAGLAARGDELAEIVQRSNPALRELNRVLGILATENRTLSDLARDGDTVVSALARQRESLAGFINQSNVVGEATAERRTDLEEGLAKLPGFLRELRSTMTQLSRFSDAATPVFGDLGNAAPSLTALSKATGPFSTAATESLTSLCRAAEGSGGPLAASDPVVRQIRALARAGAPATDNLKRFLGSFDKAKGFSTLLKTIFGIGGAVNVFDSYGHLLRALVPLQNCFDYTSIPQAGCSAKFGAAVARATTPTSERPKPKSRDEDKPRKGSNPDQGPAGNGSQSGAVEPPADAESAGPEGPGSAPETPGGTAPDAAEEGAPTDHPGAGTRAGTAATRTLLEFLIGDEGRPGQ
jgi:phospholipid/cholesterol/gamma-HCH transport system substrate-binding protein